jgi:hypothetical protein
MNNAAEDPAHVFQDTILVQRELSLFWSMICRMRDLEISYQLPNNTILCDLQTCRGWYENIARRMDRGQTVSMRYAFRVFEKARNAEDDFLALASQARSGRLSRRTDQASSSVE